MKKLLITLSLLAIFAIGQAQKARVPFFRPVPVSLFTSDASSLKTLKNASVWIFRPATSVIANQFTYNPATKELETSSFSKIGIGGSYSKYVEVDGLPYNSFNVNAFVFFPVNDEGLSFAVTVGALRFINAGIGYDVKIKKVFGLTGIQYVF